MQKSSFRFALLLISMVWAVGAQAMIIPIDYTTSGLVGTADNGGGATSVANELIWANQILALAAGTTELDYMSTGVDYRTHDTDEYTGVLTGGVQHQFADDANMVAAGTEYVLGKYDGQNAGYVLFYLGGAASTIPAYSDDIWTNIQGAGYQLSHYTAFGDGTTSLSEPGTLGLMMIGMMGVGAFRRRRSVK
jgi:hypothetical protein